ncbi:MAG: hypothetical protein M0R33_06750 [Methylomonas sp.]|jgi:hypothetical protein|uniref:hypothetical protein n=1 Tax=Methylomonas sp. TaxID=418 RepID=UPI0025ECE3E9|nr:hypothetical protein [Methylomonas sp.]MCK9606137.1 hypothetical protein [Methylomonas sp.]
MASSSLLAELWVIPVPGKGQIPDLLFRKNNPIKLAVWLQMSTKNNGFAVSLRMFIKINMAGVRLSYFAKMQ